MEGTVRAKRAWHLTETIRKAPSSEPPEAISRDLPPTINLASFRLHGAEAMLYVHQVSFHVPPSLETWKGLSQPSCSQLGPVTSSVQKVNFCHLVTQSFKGRLLPRQRNLFHLDLHMG